MSARAALTYQPRLLGEAEAAACMGVSLNTLRAMPIPRKRHGARVLYHRHDLDSYAASIAYDGEDAGEREAEACDRAFGI